MPAPLLKKGKPAQVPAPKHYNTSIEEENKEEEINKEELP
jgi:hypothetical protein